MKYYKFLNSNGCSTMAEYPYNIPKYQPDRTYKPGKWMDPVKGKLIPCVNGYHVCRANDLIWWIESDLWCVQIQEKGMLTVDTESFSKVVTRRCRLLGRVPGWRQVNLRKFSAWCAQQAISTMNPVPEFLARAVEEAAKIAETEYPSLYAIRGAADRLRYSYVHSNLSGTDFVMAYQTVLGSLEDNPYYAARCAVDSLPKIGAKNFGEFARNKNKFSSKLLEFIGETPEDTQSK